MADMTGTELIQLKKKPLLAASCALALACVASDASAAKPQLDSHSAGSRSPNVVTLLADDLGYRDLGCYGGPVWKDSALR